MKKLRKRGNVVKIAGDRRLATLLDKVTDTLYERGAGLPIAGVIGVLVLIGVSVIKQALEDEA